MSTAAYESDTDPEPLVHIEEFDKHGHPTGYALCDTGEGGLDLPGGTLAGYGHAATCQACIDFEPADGGDDA
jgi:hypothetical protein